MHSSGFALAGDFVVVVIIFNVPIQYPALKLRCLDKMTYKAENGLWFVLLFCGI